MGVVARLGKQFNRCALWGIRSKLLYMRLLLIGTISFSLTLTACTGFILRNSEQEQFVMKSQFTGRSYEMTVLLPPDYDPQQMYPSVYLIDGHWHVKNAASDAYRLMKDNEIRDILLIGIAYHDITPNGLNGYAEISELRIDDLTYTKNQDTDERGGNALQFRQFIKDELIPEVESRYATNANERTLMGHSLGGYFGIWEMLTFQDSSLYAYVEAGSPALWWADGYLLGLEAGLGEAANMPFRLHTTMGTMESVVWNTFYDEFEARLTEKQYSGLSYQFERYPVGHAASAKLGFKDGLIYFFGN